MTTRTPDAIGAEQVTEWNYPLHSEWKAGDVVGELHYDQSPEAPWDSQDFFPTIALDEVNHVRHYKSNGDPITSLEIDCPHCENTGFVYGEHDAEGECKHCDGSGYMDADDLVHYVMVNRGAVCALAINYGSGQDYCPAVIYWTAEDVAGMGMAPEHYEDGLKASAQEVADWGEGNVFGYVVTWPGGEDSCWGFVGEDYALDALTEAMENAVYYAAKERTERAHWAARDTVTVA